MIEEENNIVSFSKKKNEKLKKSIQPKSVDEIFKGLVMKMTQLAGNLEYIKESLLNSNKHVAENSIKLKFLKERVDSLEERYNLLDAKSTNINVDEED